MKDEFGYEFHIEWQGKTYTAVPQVCDDAPCAECAFDHELDDSDAPCPIRAGDMGLACPPNHIWQRIDPLHMDLKKVQEAVDGENNKNIHTARRKAGLHD